MTACQVLSNALIKEDLDAIFFSYYYSFSPWAVEPKLSRYYKATRLSLTCLFPPSRRSGNLSAPQSSRLRDFGQAWGQGKLCLRRA